MKLLAQVDLGFNQMKAAILGRHNLIDALAELCQMVNTGYAPHAIEGGIGCLLFCVEAIDSNGLLPVIESREWHEFLHGGHAHRLSICIQALKAHDLNRLGQLTAVLTCCIGPHQSRISFKSWLPVLI